MTLLLFLQQVSNMPDGDTVIHAKDLIQINATMIAGILIFYTIPYITGGLAVWKKENPSEKVVLASIVLAIGLFATSSILAFMIIIPYNLYWSYLFTIIGFGAITIAPGTFIKVIKIPKEEKKTMGRVEIMEYGPLPAEDDEIKKVQEEELQRTRKQEKLPVKESESFVSMWPQPKEEPSDKSPIYDVGD